MILVANDKHIMTPSPIPYHQELSRELGFKLFSFVKENDLGHVYYAPLDVYFSETDVFQPDILFKGGVSSAVLKGFKVELIELFDGRRMNRA